MELESRESEMQTHNDGDKEATTMTNRHERGRTMDEHNSVSAVVLANDMRSAVKSVSESMLSEFRV